MTNVFDLRVQTRADFDGPVYFNDQVYGLPGSSASYSATVTDLLAATSQAQARAALGIVDPSAFGTTMLGWVDAAAGRTALGVSQSSTYGASLQAAASASAARSLLGITLPSTFGATLDQVADAAAARTALGVTLPTAYGASLNAAASASAAVALLGGPWVTSVPKANFPAKTPIVLLDALLGRLNAITDALVAANLAQYI